MIHFKPKSTEEVIKIYLKDVYSTFRGSKYILSDRGHEVISKQFTWLDQELEFLKVYTSFHTPTANAVIERTHAFLRTSLRKPFCNHNTDWDEIAYSTAMAYNVFPHSSAGEASFYLMFGCETFMPTWLKLLLPKCRYMGDEKCNIHLHAMWEIYMMAACNFKITWGKCPHPLRDPDKTIFKVGYKVLLKNHTQIDAFNKNINLASEFVK